MASINLRRDLVLFTFFGIPLFFAAAWAESPTSKQSSAWRSPSVQLPASGDAITVTSYGAVGDGTTDDTASIRAAIAATPKHGRLRFPAGLYKVSSEIAVETDDVVLDFDAATLLTVMDTPVLRLGAGPLSTSVYSGITMIGRLTIRGAGAGNNKNTCLTIRNLSYGHLAASVKITNCGGLPFVFASYRRGVQHNYVGGGWEITSNPAGAWEIRAEGVGGYVNDNTFQTIRSHRNGSGGITHARITGQVLENNTFSNIAVETTSASDRLLEIHNGKGNIFIGLRLDGRSDTKALEVRPAARANVFIGLVLDGQVSDESGSSIVLSNRSQHALPFIRLGGAVRLEGGRRVDEIVVFANRDATPSVSSGNTFRSKNTDPTTITAFTDMADGQRFTIILDPNTTIQHGSRIKLAGGMNLLGKPNATISFVTYGGVAYETARSLNN